MNAYLRKEIRLLLPSFSFALLLALSNLLFPEHTREELAGAWFVIPFFICPAVVVFLALESFGREFSSNTFTNLLAQPVLRERIWRAKTLLSFAAVALVLAVWWWSFTVGSVSKTISTNPQTIREFMLATGIFALTIYSGGLWTSLLFRQVAVAFWFVLLVPGLLIVSLTGVMEIQNRSGGNKIIIGVMVAYSIAGFLFARWLFMRAQDVQWTGGTITMPTWFRLPSRTVVGISQTRRPLLALIKKEIQLHQAQFVMAGALVLLHLGVLLARHYASSLAVRYGVLDVIYKGFWVLWLVMPFLVGCGAIAEERRVGTLESQLCLPTRRRTQFFVKFTIALGIAMLVGALLPYLFEGNRILPELKFGNDEQFSEVNIARAIKFAESSWVVVWIRLALFVREILPVLALVGIAALSVSVAFYASSSARNTLQALAPGVLGFIAGVFLLLTAHSPESAVGYALWRGPLVYLIGLPVLVVTLAWLTYWNFKRVTTGWVVWRRNVFTLLGALTCVIVATTVIYQRAWEMLAPSDPMHGPAKFAKGSSARFLVSNFKVITELPDGRTRFDYFAPYASGLWSMLTHGYKLQHLANRSRIELGTNWFGIVDCYHDQAWLRSDGSLWAPEKPELMMFSKPAPKTPAPLVRKGQDHDWKQIVSFGGGSILLLKTNGSLWQLGDKLGKGWETNWPGLIGSRPKRLGTNSDWAELFSIQQQTCLRKQDGSLWSTQPNGSTEISSEPLIVSDGLKLYPALHLGDGKWHGVGWMSVPRLGGMLVGVHEGGEFRIVAGWEPGPKKKNSFVLAAKQGRIGNQTNWVSMASDADDVITLRADGTLWRWKFVEDPIQYPDSSVVTRLGSNSDWVGIASYYKGILALAADGGIWYWVHEPPRNNYMSSNLEGIFRPLLRLSRKPQLIGNIFAKSE